MWWIKRNKAKVDEREVLKTFQFIWIFCVKFWTFMSFPEFFISYSSNLDLLSYSVASHHLPKYRFKCVKVYCIEMYNLSISNIEQYYASKLTEGVKVFKGLFEISYHNNVIVDWPLISLQTGPLLCSKWGLSGLQQTKYWIKFLLHPAFGAFCIVRVAQ